MSAAVCSRSLQTARTPLQGCIKAINNGVSRVHILDGRLLHSILLEIFTKKGIGTVFYREGDVFME